LVTLSLQDHGTHDRLPADRQLTAADDDHKAILPAVWRNQRADDRGAFEFYAAPGKYVLRAFAAPSFNAVREVTVTGREPVEVDLRPGGGGGGDAAGEPSPVQHVTPGRVVLRDRPDAGGVADVALTGRSAASDHFTGASDRQGNFTLRHGAADMYLYAVSDDGTLRGVVIARAADAAVTVPVGPTASAVGRLLDPEGKPIAGRPVRYGIRIGTPERGYSDSFGGTTRTAADGTFTVDGLVPGHEYHLTVAVSFYPNGEPRVWQGIGVATADGAGRVDLGDRRLPKPPAANEPRPWQAQQADAFAADAGPVEARLDEARERARAARLRVLVVLGAPGHAACDEFFQYASDPARYDVRGPLADYTVVAVDSDHNEQATVWARASDVPWPARGMTLAVLDPAGAVVARSAAEPLSVDGKLDRTRLAEFLTRNRPPGPSPATATAGQGAAAAGANDPGRVADPAHTGFRPGQKLPPLTAVAWRFRQEPTKVGGSLRWPGMTDPIAAGGDVYFGDDRGVLRALRAVDGAPVWTYEHGERILGPVVDDERVYFTSPTGVTAVRRADGKAAWQFDIEGGGSEAGGVVWAPTDTLFCGGGDGFVYAIDRRTGRQRWKHGVVADAPPDPPGFPGARARLGKSPARLTGVATDGRTVFQSVFDQSRVVAIDAATGERRWSFQARGWIHGAPAVGERHVFVGSQDGRLYCLDKATGNQAWSFATHGRVESTPGLADDRVFVASCDGTFYCLEVATAAIAWSFTTDRGPTGMRAIYSRPILTPDAVYFAAGEGQAYALGRENGRLLWKLRPSESSQLFTSPATDGTRLFLTTRAGIDESGETSVVAVGP
jgi:outer membrane protein assembly factor BamB